jgi:hypothetical protein
LGCLRGLRLLRAQRAGARLRCRLGALRSVAMEHIDPSEFNVAYLPGRPGTHAFGAKVDVIPRQGEVVRFTGPLGEQEVTRVIHEHPSGLIQIVLQDC